MAPSQKTIDIHGQVVQTTEDESTTSVSRRLRIPERIDVFGFSLTPAYFLILLLLARLMLGEQGFLTFCIIFGIYTGFCWCKGGSSNSSNSSSRSQRSSRRMGGWKNGSGNHIKGIQDLPKSPTGG